MLRFYEEVYIILRWVFADGAIYADASHPVCPYGIPWRECESRAMYTSKCYIFPEIPHGESAYPTVPQSASLTAPEVALQPVAQEDASGVDTVNSRVNCFAISLAALPPPIHQGENVNFELRTRQRATFLPNFPQRKCQPQFTHTPRASSSQK